MKIYYYCYYFFFGKIYYTRPIQVERQLMCVQVSVFPLVYPYIYIYIYIYFFFNSEKKVPQ